MNRRCYEYSQNSICLNSFDNVFIHKEVRCTKKANIKEGLQCSNKKLSLPGCTIRYIFEDLVIK